MLEDILFLSAPFCMCLALLGIHCYLGLHVLAREVIFVDLALAQIAALGSAIGLLIGFEPGTWEIYLVSLSSTLVVAFFLANTRKLRFHISQEAIIGILYALASASIILLADQLSHGSEILKQSLVGKLLWVTWLDVTKVFLIYSAVGIVHFVYRKWFLQASFKQGAPWKWDFLFYALFGVVITSSVQVAGILLVFSFLIVPAVLSSMFFSSLTARLFFGWTIGAVLCAIGMSLSYTFDLPSGAIIVLVFTLAPVLSIALFWRIFRFKQRLNR